MAKSSRNSEKIVKNFIFAQTANKKKKRIVEEHRSLLLTDAVDLIFGKLFKQYKGNANMTRLLEEHRDLLRRCRRDGIEAAFADRLRLDELQTLLSEIEQLSSPSDMSRRTELCRAALRLVKSDTQPQQWAALQCQLAKSLERNPQGECADNLEQAILHLQQALKVYTRQAFPVEWAWTHNDLALAHIECIQGERADNLEQAILHGEQALEVLTRQAFPEQWAMAHFNLATAYYERMQDERTDNLEQAIDHLKQALEVFTRQAFPERWAMTQRDLALAYTERLHGKHAGNLEQAIHYLEEVLEIYTRQTYPEDWAATQNTLGTAYRKRIQGEYADNIEQAIAHYEQALVVHTRQAFPKDWAIIQNNLGVAYLVRIQGERAENLEQAILYLERAIEVLTHEDHPKQWAATQNNLANAYQQRIYGERADNLERAISHLAQALDVYISKALPIEWARTQNNLGNVYYKRIRGERADNLEHAIAHYEQALELITHKASPVEWAQIQTNLGVVYRERIRGDRADNLEHAIAHYEQALLVRTHHALPRDWALIQNNLGIAYRNRIYGDRVDNLEQAIDCFKQALLVRTRHALPEQWAITQTNLANAYYIRLYGEHADNLEQAIDHLKQALEVFTRQAFPERWAIIQHNLAFAYRERIRGESADNLEQAIVHFKLALEVRTLQTFPQDCRDSSYWLGRLLYDEHRYLEARQVLATAHQAVEALRSEVKRDIAKRSLAEENVDLYRRLVSCCLVEGDEGDAFELAVAGKGRAFVDLLATSRLDLSALGANNPALAKDLDTAQALRQQIDNLYVALTDLNSLSISSLSPDTVFKASDQPSLLSDELRIQLRALQVQEKNYWEDMAYRYPALTATQRAPALSVDQARTLAASLDATLVEYYQHAQGWCAFVVTPHTLHYIPLPLLDNLLLAHMANWVKHVESKTNLGFNQLSYRRLSEWHSAVIAPLQAYLPLGQPVVLAPFGQLHVLPLAAARDPRTGRYVAEDYLISFTPSLAALRIARDQVHGKNEHVAPRRLLNVAYPGVPENKEYYLSTVLLEAQAIAAYFEHVTPLYENAATPDAVIKHSRNQDMIHFGCHGQFDVEQPEQSGLMLSGGCLTVQRIITELQLDQVHLATLGACRSGRAKVQSGDEYVGLLQAMLTSRVQAVVASLWKVDDQPTYAFFAAFYAKLTAGYTPASALREAARVVREDPRHPGWKHPYFWAAFQVSGLAHSAEEPT